MKFFSAAIAAITFSFANGNASNEGRKNFNQNNALGPSMWLFSPDGLSIYTPSGDLLKQHRKKSLCEPYMSRGQWNDDCYFYSYASDGHKYVWAGSLAADNRVMAFDIDTGDYAGYHPTCSTPLNLEYQSSRQEMWLRCAGKTNEYNGEIQVFSSNSLSSDYKLVNLNEGRRPYGRIAVHSSLGTYGYASSYGQNHIIQFDLSTKTVKAQYEIPEAFGFYDLTYSPFNEHLYVRTRVCCSCGFKGADLEECGRYSGMDTQKVLVQTGPNADTNEQVGACSAMCEGTAADTIGVAEFDTVSKTFVATHNIKDGTGHGADPVSSPDGKYVLFLPNDGGKFIRLIKPGKNGEASTVAVDIPVNFEGAAAGKSVVSDMAFIQDEDRNILIIGANSDNNLVLVDLDDNYKTKKLPLTNDLESTSSRDRKVEWAVGSNYVWIDGGDADEVYIVEITAGIETARVKRTMTDVKTSNFIFANNYDSLRAEKAAFEKMMSSIETYKVKEVYKAEINEEEVSSLSPLNNKVKEVYKAEINEEVSSLSPLNISLMFLALLMTVVAIGKSAKKI